MEDERVIASAVWQETLATIRRHPMATLAPAVLLGAFSEAPYLLPDSLYALQDTLAFVTQAFAFYLYAAYAEEVSIELQRTTEPISLSRALRKLLLVVPVVPLMLVAALAAVALPSIAASLLAIPGLWLLTRWSLFAPVIVRERLGPLAALSRSSELVRNHFELVFLTAAFAILLEEAVMDMGAFVGLLISGSDIWGEWIGSLIASVLILPLASLATAITYGLILRQS